MANEPVPTKVYRQTVVDLVERFQPSIIAEIGAYACDLTKMMLKVPCVSKIYVIDPWTWPVPFHRKYDQDHMDAVAEEVRKWALGKDRVRVYRLPAHEASKLFHDQSVDFAHDDGVHEYEALKDDIACFAPKMKPGGVFTGDNYEKEEVRRAVDEAFGDQVQLFAKGRIWLVQSDDWSKFNIGEPRA
jgi:hypothetical protein